MSSFLHYPSCVVAPLILSFYFFLPFLLFFVSSLSFCPFCCFPLYTTADTTKSTATKEPLTIASPEFGKNLLWEKEREKKKKKTQSGPRSIVLSKLYPKVNSCQEQQRKEKRHNQRTQSNHTKPFCASVLIVTCWEE